MTNVDQFESVFRSAAKETFQLEPVEIRKIVTVTDLEGDDNEKFQQRIRDFFTTSGDSPDVVTAPEDEVRSVGRLLNFVKDQKPDLVCSYRNLFSDAWRWPYGLGEHLDVLTQVAPCPVLIMPHPEDSVTNEKALTSNSSIMAITDHLAGEAHLVSYAAHFTSTGGTLWLVHVEDKHDYDRIIDAISKIPSIDTDDARETILKQLLKEPADYVASCQAGLAEHGDQIKTESIITVGHRLNEYRRIVDEHTVDLLVFETRDEGQLAMGGFAYSLAVELRGTPILAL